MTVPKRPDVGDRVKITDADLFWQGRVGIVKEVYLEIRPYTKGSHEWVRCLYVEDCKPRGHRPNWRGEWFDECQLKVTRRAR